MRNIEKLLPTLALLGLCSTLFLPRAQARIPTQNQSPQYPATKGNGQVQAITQVADAKATAKACAAARLDLALPRSIVATAVPSNTLGMANLNWTPGLGADPSVTFSIQTQMLGSGGWVNWRGNGFPPYNANSFTVSGLPLFQPLKFGIFAVKWITANLPDSNGVLHSQNVKCQTDPVFSNTVMPTRTAFQVGVLPPKPIPSIPAGDDIILYVHGGPGSRLEEASDLVAPLQREGLAVGKHYTIISFDQVSQGYSSMIDPDALLPRHQNNVDYYPMVAFSENSIVAFLHALDPLVSLHNRNIYVIGGSTGGALALRMGRSQQLQAMPWVKKVVAWNPASVWTTYTHDAVKGIALNQGFGRATDSETVGGGSDSRKGYFDGVFGPPISGWPGVKVQPNPEEWYRGDRGPSQDSNRNPYPQDTHQPFRSEWACKWDYIGGARVEWQEVYNQLGRRWHYRLGTEELLFSFFNDSWLGPANTAPDKGGNPANYLDIVKPTLLVASDDDDWNEGYVSGLDVAPFSAWAASMVAPGPGTALGGVLGGVIGAVGGDIHFRWEDRWTQVNKMAPLMKNTPGSTLFVPNTGHSIHNERPNFFANQIVGFLASPAPGSGPLQVGTLFDETKMPWDACQPQLSQFPPPIPQLLDNADSAKFLMEPAQLGGNFSNGTSSGQYSLRLQWYLRDTAAAKDPTSALAYATASFYKGDNILGNALADLAVTGRDVYAAFRNQPPTANNIMAAALALKARSSIRSAVLTPVLAPPVDQTKLLQAAQAVLTRAYSVAWALRNPDPMVAYWFRQTLGWIAVSGEDDSPDRPVNVPSGIPMFDHNGNQISSYPQYDVQITVCPAADPASAPGTCGPVNTVPVPIQIRYSIASLPAASATPSLTGITTNLGPQPVQGARPSVGSVMQTPSLTANVCLTGDGRNCLPPNALRPTMGQRRQTIVTVLSGGQPVSGATVSVSGQYVGVLTNASGVAVLNYNGCISRTIGPGRIPVSDQVSCQASATKSGYQPFSFALP